MTQFKSEKEIKSLALLPEKREMKPHTGRLL